MAAPARFSRQRVLTKTEASALGYQSQGSYPSGLKNVRSYALRSTLHFANLCHRPKFSFSPSVPPRRTSGTRTS